MDTNHRPDTSSSEETSNHNSQKKPVGESIKKLAEDLGAIHSMDEDNKKMLDQVSKATTEKEAIQTLLTDPNTGRTMSYAESRSRFG